MRRKTRQREAVLRVVQSTRSHPTADRIYEEVKKEIPNISKGTVYRNLQVLKEVGAILEIRLDGVSSRFEATRESHHHFRCERCGRVIDVDVPIDEELDRSAAERTGLKISGHRVEFLGLCHDCQHK